MERIFDLSDIQCISDMVKYAEKLEAKRYHAGFFPLTAKKRDQRFHELGQKIHGTMLDISGMTGRIVNMTYEGQLVFGDGSRSLLVDWVAAKKRELTDAQ